MSEWQKAAKLIMNIFDYYKTQSPFTEPGAQVATFADVPRDIGAMCRIVQGLIIHFRDGEELFDCSLPGDRLVEADTRYVEKMLARILELDSRPLDQARSPENRLIGSCRDFATLFVSMLRYHGIPSRVRFGFGAYFIPDFNVDHVIAEVWDEKDQRWRLIDPEMSNLHVEWYKIPFDPHDVPRGKFIVGGLAFQICQSGKADPEHFGVEPGATTKGWLGWPAIQHKLVEDVAALNKVELLPWDVSGLMGRAPEEQEGAKLDKAATLSQAGNDAFPLLRQFYKTEPEFRVPPVVVSYSPAKGPHEVSLESLTSD